MAFCVPIDIDASLRGKTQEVVDKIGEEKGPCFINYHYKIHPKHEKNRQVPDVLFCKSSLSKVASVKTNKIKKQTAFLHTVKENEYQPLCPFYYGFS